jgi:hypothetical protein
MSAATGEVPVGIARGHAVARCAGRAALLAILPFVGGCGPTPEELLAYEMILVGVGLGLGMSMWWVGHRMGNRLSGRWFVCSHCLSPQLARVPDGQIQLCASCGQQSSVNELDRQTLLELQPAGYALFARWAAWRWTLALTTGTLAAFFTISCTVRLLAYMGVRIKGLPDWLAFPLAIMVTCCGERWLQWPLIGYGLCFYCYEFVCLVSRSMDAFDLPLRTQLAAAYGPIVGIIAAHWYAGLRGWRRGWLLPAAIAVANILAAVVAYLLRRLL